MKKIMLIILVSLATVGGLATAKYRYNFQFSPSVHPLVIIYKSSTTHLQQGQTRPVTDADRFVTMAIRSDGAVMKANAIPDPSGHIGIVRSIQLQDRYVVIDPQTESISTYQPKRPAIVPSQDCGGPRDVSILGHPTEVVTEGAKPNIHYRQETTKKWLAVDLNCIPLREFYVKDGDSDWAQVTREAISVQVGDPPAEYFDVPTNYQERGPKEIDAVMFEKSGKHVLAEGDPAVLDKLERAYKKGAQPQGKQ